MSNRRNALVAATLAAALGCSASSAFAADDGYQDVFSSVLTAVGLLSPDKTPDIDYRERAPLVLPPKMNLAKPVNPASERTASWPQDPDVAKRRKAAAEARAPSRNVLGNPGVVVGRDEMMKGRLANGDPSAVPDSAVRQANCGNQGNQRNCLVVSPDELAAMNDRYKASGQGEKTELVAGQEPDRVYLTQPPKGYLKVSKTIKATAEAPKPKVDDADPKAALMYHPPTDDE